MYGRRSGAGFEHGTPADRPYQAPCAWNSTASGLLHGDRQICTLSTALLVIRGFLILVSATWRPYLATLDVVEFERHVSGPGDELARNEHQVVDSQ